MAGNQDTAFRVREAYGRELEAGEAVFDEGDPGGTLYVIQTGEIELSRRSPKGQRVVGRLGPGDFFGEFSLVSGGQRLARAVAVRRTRVLELDAPTLEAMCMAQPEIAIRLIRVLATRLMEAEQRLEALGMDDLLRPVIRALVRRAEPLPGAEGGYRIPLTLRTLSESVGLSMREVHRALHRLFDVRLLRLVDDVLQAPDLEALSGCMDSGLVYEPAASGEAGAQA